MTIIVNKNNIFNEEMIKDFEMEEYENYNEETIYIEKETLKHFEMLQAHLKVEDIIIDIDSGYRSLESQENIFVKNMSKYGLEETEKIIEMPGFSEHHLGQSIDFCIFCEGKWIKDQNEIVKLSEILNRIYKSLKYFGFILRYPKDKEKITYRKYEPNHIRYVGEKIAKEINEQTLEEYLEI